MCSDALRRESLEAPVKLRRNMQVIVVIRNNFHRGVALLRIFERSWGKALGFYGAPWHRPIDFLDRRVVRHPSLHPAVETHGDELVFFVGVARRERLKALEHA